ncbi:MAG: hypothetical protein KatS3mg001_118 [Candidatus Pacearchaeota archaeon]|nr:MAG: hypothetical protein KatS3mg001_118 [Candidatus Pacearchaeota archaeon]
MPYKKYIKRGDKIYGPYIYESKRVGDKVITEYKGPGKKFNINFFIFLAAFLVIFLVIFFILNKNQGITGRALIDLEAKYQEGKPLEGKLNIKLKEGELLPEDTKISFDNNGKIIEYPLENIISEQKESGNFYIEGAELSGSGLGYGIPGEKKIFPKVYFTLIVLSENKTQTEENTNETQQQEQQLEQQKQETPITGNFISNFFRTTGNFLGITGNVVAEFEREIQGEASALENFSYQLQENERVELKPRSVRTDSKILDDNEIKISLEKNNAVVSTNYFETEKGFGKDYLGNKTKNIEIDLSKLSLFLEPGSLKISLKSNNTELIYLTTTLEQGSLKLNETANQTSKTEKQQEESSLTKEETSLTNLTTNTNFTILNSTNELTAEEKEILEREFGSTKVQIKEAREINNRLILRYEIGNQWIEFSYDKNIDNETLQKLISKDTNLWLKDLASRFKKQETTEISSLTGVNISF